LRLFQQQGVGADDLLSFVSCCTLLTAGGWNSPQVGPHHRHCCGPQAPQPQPGVSAGALLPLPSSRKLTAVSRAGHVLQRSSYSQALQQWAMQRVGACVQHELVLVSNTNSSVSTGSVTGSTSSGTHGELCWAVCGAVWCWARSTMAKGHRPISLQLWQCLPYLHGTSSKTVCMGCP
jgi:hypothetical protein